MGSKKKRKRWNDSRVNYNDRSKGQKCEGEIKKCEIEKIKVKKRGWGYFGIVGGLTCGGYSSDRVAGILIVESIQGD